jgi:subtilisin family serine protease
MTWTVLGQSGDYVHVGSDGQTDPYHGDTTIDQFLPILCLRVDGRTPPDGIGFDIYNGWSHGEVKATPAIAATVLTSREVADQICADEFGAGWRLAEFHDGRYGADLNITGGWSFWASGALPAGTRFWASINDQPANPWDSVGEIPEVAMPKFIPSEYPVPGRYLAMFPEDTPESSVEGLANELVAAYGGTIEDVMPGVAGFSFTGNDPQAQAMSADGRIESVEQDTYGQPTIEWHQDRVDQRALPRDLVYAPPNDGAGVNIYILDTGFRRSHQEFGGRARQDADFIRFLGQRDDCHGHGTAVGSSAAGATVGIAPGANLISIRVAGCNANPYNPVVTVFNTTIVAGLDWVARHHVKPAVASVSYSVNAGFWRRLFKSRSPIDRAARRAVDAGVTVIAAAGNDGEKVRKSPAREGAVITVGATDGGDKRWSHSNWGKVDIFAPGLSIKVATIDNDSSYDTTNGTSLSAPMVAGGAAIYLNDHPNASPGEVRAALQDQATQDVVRDPGSGSANRLLFVGFPPGNLARSASASASSTFSNYSPARVNDGSTDTSLGGAYSWANNSGTYPPLSPEWVQLDFGTTKTFRRVLVYTSQGYPIQDFDIQVENGGTWTTIPGTQVRGNTDLVVSRTFSAQSAQRVRILAYRGPSHQDGYVRVNEFEVYTR